MSQDRLDQPLSKTGIAFLREDKDIGKIPRKVASSVTMRAKPICAPSP